MILLVLGVAIFVGVHLVPTAPALREGAVQRLGENTYQGLFSAVALLGLVLIIVGKAYADFVPLWQPPSWGRHVAQMLMLPAFMLLAAANMPTNIKRFTRHPMLWGVVIWSGVHLLANGDLAALVLFGGIGAYSLFDMWSANRRGATKSDIRYPLTKDLAVVIGGTVVYGVFLFLHPYLFGVPAIT